LTDDSAESRAVAGSDEKQPNDGAFDVVVTGYDAVYPAAAASPTFTRLWAQHACGGDFPAAFAHISFLTFDELRAMSDFLALGEGDVLLDLACGAGGPGLWLASRSGASLIGVDPSATGLAEARKRAERVGLADRAHYQHGTFGATGLDDAAADGAVSVDAIQYSADKRAVFAEARRILRRGARFAFSAFELEPERVRDLPVFGIDPISDYGPLLEDAGFAIDRYRESDGWDDRVRTTFAAVMETMPTLVEEMGEMAAASLGAEASITLKVEPYRRRVVVNAVAL
jgi:SAM-dependent methyltransferase